MSAVGDLLDRLPGRHPVRDVTEGVAGIREDAKALGKSEGTLLSGKKVRGRFAQSFTWSSGTAYLAAAFMAGLYFGILQVRWYIHIGDFYVQLFYLKPWWDHLFPYDWWALYRHAAFRDIAEPAIASMAVKTLLASRKWWGVRVSNLRVITSPLVVLFMVFALGVLGVWLIDFALPAAWAWFWSLPLIGDPGFKVSAHFLGKLSLPQAIVGIVIGQIVHRYWAPVGATLQGGTMDRSVDRKWIIARRVQEKTGITMEQVIEADNAGWHLIPAWARLPLSPPVVRERYADAWRNNASVKTRKGHGKVIVVAVVFIVLVTLLGLAGHVYVGVLHHSIPYLAP